MANAALAVMAVMTLYHCAMATAPARSASAVTVTVDTATGAYTVAAGGATLFASGATKYTAGGVTKSTADGSLKLASASHGTGVDALGAYTATVCKLSLHRADQITREAEKHTGWRTSGMID